MVNTSKTKVYLDGKLVEYILRVTVTLLCDAPVIRAQIVRQLPGQDIEKLKADVSDIRKQGDWLELHCVLADE